MIKKYNLTNIINSNILTSILFIIGVIVWSSFIFSSSNINKAEAQSSCQGNESCYTTSWKASEILGTALGYGPKESNYLSFLGPNEIGIAVGMKKFNLNSQDSFAKICLDYFDNKVSNIDIWAVAGSKIAEKNCNQAGIHSQIEGLMIGWANSDVWNRSKAVTSSGLYMTPTKWTVVGKFK